jgi:uncharacterized protein YbaA (DUF1428 family)
MSYVEGFLAPVPKNKKAAYRRLSKTWGEIWMKYGAVSFTECMADGKLAKGKWTSFPRAVKLKPNETVVFSWIVYKSKADRDRIFKKAMSDPKIIKAMDPKKMPFDGKRMIFGGFKPIVEL